MQQRKIFAIMSAILVAGSSAGTAAWAQAVRTWVSGVGDDVNPCSRTAPCKTFAGAISKTSPGGEINCLDPAGYGAVTITRSITIDCEDTQGSILAGSVNGVIVNDGATGFPGSIRVVLRGLSINGAQSGAQNAQGNPGSGLNGVRFISGRSLTIERVIIQNFNATGTNGFGISFQPSTSAALTVINSTIAYNGSAAGGGGILIQPTGVGGNARVVLTRVDLADNGNAGLRINTTGNTGSGIRVNVTDSEFNGNVNGISLLVPAGTTGVNATITGSTMFRNTGVGLLGDGSSMNVRVANSTIAENGTGVSRLNGAVINSYLNNRLIGNGTDGTFSGSVTPQ
jgi:hypothetical protein